MSRRSKNRGDWFTEIMIEAFVIGVMATGFFLMNIVQVLINEAMRKNLAKKKRIEEKNKILKEKKQIADAKRIAMNKKRRPTYVNV